MPFHETELNLLRDAVIAMNKASILGLSNSLVNQSLTITTLKDVLNGVSLTKNNVITHETDKNHMRHIANILDKVSANGLNLLTDAEITASSTFALLKGELTEEIPTPAPFGTDLDFGDQAVS